jgi:hypothetical protein
VSDMLKESEIRGYRDSLKAVLHPDCKCPTCDLKDALQGSPRAKARDIIETLSWVLGERHDLSGRVEAIVKGASDLAKRKAERCTAKKEN